MKLSKKAQLSNIQLILDGAARQEYSRDEVVRNLWQAYQKTEEYRVGRTESISSVHPLVRKREADALNRIFNEFVERLRRPDLIRDRYENKNIGEWIMDWKRMHSTLFHDVLRRRGEWRQTDVRFGAPGDEERHRIPRWQMVAKEMNEFAYVLSKELREVVSGDIDSICEYLAKIHYQFIRIHPFPDGNGRIARVLTDQLAVSLGLPPVVTGFPRSNQEKKSIYHHAITECMYDARYTTLKVWIKDQIESKIDELA